MALSYRARRGWSLVILWFAALVPAIVGGLGLARERRRTGLAYVRRLLLGLLSVHWVAVGILGIPTRQVVRLARSGLAGIKLRVGRGLSQIRCFAVLVGSTKVESGVVSHVFPLR